MYDIMMFKNPKLIMEAGETASNLWHLIKCILAENLPSEYHLELFVLIRFIVSYLMKLKRKSSLHR